VDTKLLTLVKAATFLEKLDTFFWQPRLVNRKFSASQKSV